VMDLKQQWFYWFLRMTIGFHVLMFWTVLYLYGGLPYLTCGGVNLFLPINYMYTHKIICMYPYVT